MLTDWAIFERSYQKHTKVVQVLSYFVEKLGYFLIQHLVTLASKSKSVHQGKKILNWKGKLIIFSKHILIKHCYSLGKEKLIIFKHNDTKLIWCIWIDHFKLNYEVVQVSFQKEKFLQLFFLFFNFLQILLY